MSPAMTTDINSIEWWADNLRGIYEKKLSDREPIEVWAKVVEHGSGVGEAVRETNFRNLLLHLGQTLGWTVIFVDRTRNATTGTWSYLGVPFKKDDWDSLSHPTISGIGDIPKYHYPRICPHCTLQKCQCALGDKPDDTERQKQLVWNRNSTIADTDDTWAKLEDRFQRLFGHDDKIKSYGDIGFHFLEEIGEVSKAIRMLATSGGMTTKSPAESPTTLTWEGQLVEELADVLSWSTSVLRRVRLDLENLCSLCAVNGDPKVLRNNLALAWVMQYTYLNEGKLPVPVCPGCGKKVCKKDCSEF